ncbi:MAG TPA: hypothetical protein VM689_04635 [Aliidongia sp.]|nr:hypothetical protein [Aliidongia sp.]
MRMETDLGIRPLEMPSSLIPAEPAISAPAGPSASRGTMLGILFDAASPIARGGLPALRPLWAEEAMNRAANLLRLVLLLEYRRWAGGQSPTDLALECAHAMALAGFYGSLDVDHGDNVVPCTALLRGLMERLVKLFGPTVGRVTLSVELDRLMLPADKRRALALMSSELIIHALLDGFRGRDQAVIAATLECGSDGQIRFRIEDDGEPPASSNRPGSSHAMIGTLAGVLDAEIVYRRSPMGGMTAEFLFLP